MPKNKGKGGKNRRRGKNEADNEKRELTFKEDGQEYVQVLKMLGNGKTEVQTFEGKKYLANIRGKLRKKVWINQGDVVLMSTRDYEENKGDIILKYTMDEARSLKQYGELPETAKINANTSKDDPLTNEEDVEFAYDSEEASGGSGGDSDSDSEGERGAANARAGARKKLAEADIDDI